WSIRFNCPKIAHRVFKTYTYRFETRVNPSVFLNLIAGMPVAVCSATSELSGEFPAFKRGGLSTWVCRTKMRWKENLIKLKEKQRRPLAKLSTIVSSNEKAQLIAQKEM